MHISYNRNPQSICANTIGLMNRHRQSFNKLMSSSEINEIEINLLWKINCEYHLLTFLFCDKILRKAHDED